jgi:hypothetical protein
MDAAIINTIIKEIEKTNCNFVIKTNIARGRGINGVDYETFYGYTTADDEILRTKIVDCYNASNVLVLATDNEHCDYPFINGGKRIIYLDTNSVLSIELIKDSSYSRLPANTSAIKIDSDSLSIRLVK